MTLLTMLGNLGAAVTTSAVLFTAGWIKPNYIAYPLLVGICFVLGCLWLIAQYRTILQLETLPIEKWHLLAIKAESDNVDKDAREICLNEEEREK